MERDNMKDHEKLKSLRRQANITQMELAEKMEHCQSYVSKVENGHYKDPFFIESAQAVIAKEIEFRRKQESKGEFKWR